MASWVDKLDARIEAAKRAPKRKRGGTTEEGQTCPTCGNLYPWTAVMCPPCRRLLK